jgi:hypothetical protein
MIFNALGDQRPVGPLAIGKHDLGLANLTRLAYGESARSRPSKIDNELTSKAAING